jgi:hypothetical protein
LHTSLRFLFAVSLAILSISCSSINNKNSGDEGKIIYEVEVIGDNIDPFMLSMMPNQAEYYFKKDKTAMFLSSKGNLVRFAALSNGKKKEITQEIKLMNKKVKANFDAREIFYYTDHPSFTLIESNYKDSIVGLYADKYIVIYDDIDQKENNLIYCKNIKVTNPNWYNIYNTIPYVLLQYEYNQFGLKLKLRAKKLEFVKVDDAIFKSSDEYREIDSEEFINELKIIAESL